MSDQGVPQPPPQQPPVQPPPQQPPPGGAGAPPPDGQGPNFTLLYLAIGLLVVLGVGLAYLLLAGDDDGDEFVQAQGEVFLEPANAVGPDLVIGFEPSGSARRACKAGVELAKRLDAQIHLVTAFSDGPDAGGRMTRERRKAERSVESMALHCDPTGRRITTHAIPGRAAATIVDVATRVNADLIVVGNKGTRGARRLLGSVASAVTSRSPCAVTVMDSA